MQCKYEKLIAYYISITPPQINTILRNIEEQEIDFILQKTSWKC